MLTVDDIHGYHGESYVLQGVSLAIDAGQVVTLLGRNGAGKSTLIHSIMGLNACRRGSMRFLGEEIAQMPAHLRARLGIGLVPQGRRVFPSLTVREHLEAFCGGRKGEWTIARVLGFFPRLGERQSNRGNELSGGEQQMLAIGRTLMLNPRLVLLDEPSEGLSTSMVSELSRAIGELRQTGVAILLAEQQLRFALSVADKAYVLGRGRIVFSGSPGELSRDPEVKSRYLGI